MQRSPILAILSILIAALILSACVRPAPGSNSWSPGMLPTATLPLIPQPTRPAWLPATRVPGSPILTPTPDAPHPIPTPRAEQEVYSVQPGDTLGQIAIRYNISIDDLVTVNKLENPDILDVGQQLIIPAPTPAGPRIDFKIIPDSELVNGPVATTLNINDYIISVDGYLASYREEIDGVKYTGAQILSFISTDFSVNPRLLLAILEYQSGWVTQKEPGLDTMVYPLGYLDPNRKELYRQLAWAANNLNRGYYLWRANAINSWLLADGTMLPASPTINAGTAAVQYFFALLYNQNGWLQAVSEQGLAQTYTRLFGYPFDLALEPLVPPNLQQPPMQLPFAKGEIWSFTGGPHGAWGDGSAWGGLDFAPPGDALGCVQSDAWVVAVADGLIVRAGGGAVMQDLDGDGLEQTGWNVLYMHIETRDRVSAGTYLKAGDRIGHPSCEGGFSNGTHVHIARKYNGEWISADGTLPFNLDNWISTGAGSEYDGYLSRNGQTVEAWDARKPENQISR